MDGTSTRTADPGHPDTLEAGLLGIGAARRDLDARVLDVVGMMVRQRRWTAAIRLVVLAGGCPQSDIARATGVIRSTVNRWFNGETEPQVEQQALYLEAIKGLLGSARSLDIHARVEVVAFR